MIEAVKRAPLPHPPPFPLHMLLALPSLLPRTSFLAWLCLSMKAVYRITLLNLNPATSTQAPTLSRSAFGSKSLSAPPLSHLLCAYFNLRLLFLRTFARPDGRAFTVLPLLLLLLVTCTLFPPGVNGQVTSIVAGHYHYCVIMTIPITSGLRCWGRNTAGQCGTYFTTAELM